MPKFYDRLRKAVSTRDDGDDGGEEGPGANSQDFKKDSGCFICRARNPNMQFGLFVRRHHCRACFNSVCAEHCGGNPLTCEVCVGERKGLSWAGGSSPQTAEVLASGEVRPPPVPRDTVPSAGLPTPASPVIQPEDDAIRQQQELAQIKDECRRLRLEAALDDGAAHAEELQAIPTDTILDVRRKHPHAPDQEMIQQIRSLALMPVRASAYCC